MPERPNHSVVNGARENVHFKHFVYDMVDISAINVVGPNVGSDDHIEALRL